MTLGLKLVRRMGRHAAVLPGYHQILFLVPW